VVSSLLFGAMFGALIGRTMADPLGRRGALQVCTVTFFVGALGARLAPSFGIMVVARIILGLAVGAAAAVVPLYPAEMAPVYRRRQMVTVSELMIVGGKPLAFALNALIDSVSSWTGGWGSMLAVAVIPAIFLFAGLHFRPDSLRCYAVGGRFDETRKVRPVPG
jgi:major inositol transporter-like SP family MFS transporter